jgi:phage-related protein
VILDSYLNSALPGDPPRYAERVLRGVLRKAEHPLWRVRKGLVSISDRKGASLAGSARRGSLSGSRRVLGVTAPKKRPRRHWRDYRTAAGGRPVKAFIDALTDEEVASIVAGMKDVVERGLPSAKHLRGDVYEVRADASTRSFRLLFSAEGTYSQVLLSLSVFEKRTQKTPPRELDLAESRLREWRHRGAEKTKEKKGAAKPRRS